MTAVSRSQLQLAAICVALTGLVWLVFGQTLRHGFIDYDDGPYVYDNAQVTAGLSWPGIAWAFTHSHATNWHPLTTISHMLDCQVYGRQPWGHHLTNVLLHVASSNLLFLLLWRLTGAIWRSAVVAAIFAIHPLHVESVAWIAERKDVLSAFFFMLILLAYVRYANRPSIGRYIVLAVLFVCGLLSKPMLVTVPLVLLLLDYWPLGRFALASGSVTAANKEGGHPLSSHRGLLLEKIPLCAIAFAFCVLTLVVQHNFIAMRAALPLDWRLRNVLVSYVIYIRQMLWPSDLALLYPYPDTPLPLLETGGALLFLMTISAGAFILRKRRPYLVTGWFWYVIMLLPVIGIIQVGPQSHADRYTYLPQIGLYILAIWAVADAVAKRPAYRVIAAVTTISIVTALVTTARTQASYWRDPELLWKQTLAAFPNNYDAQMNLAVILFRKGQIEDAIGHVEVAMHKSTPGNKEFAATRDALAAGLADTGAALVRQGMPAKAVPYLEAAIKLLPDSAKDKKARASYNTGAALQEQGKVDEAITYYQKAVDFRPDYTDAYNNLANALVQKGLFADAMATYGRALNTNPASVLVRNNMAWQLAACPDPSFRDGAKAVALCEEALRMSGEPNEFVLHTLAAAYAQNHEFAKAIETANQARTLAMEKNNSRLAAALEREIALYRDGSTLPK